MKKNYLALLGVMVLAVGMFAGCGEKEAAGNVENGDDNTFVVGFDASFPPYGYRDDNGEYVVIIAS